MTLLNRSALCSGDYLASLGLPADLVWTRAQIEASLAETLASRPPGALWVFAYGSLMWNPLLAFEARSIATLPGWHRSFCLRVTAGRGSSACPGRMLALEPGGTTQGVALRLHEDLVAEELRVLWTREMVTGAYRPVWTPVQLADGSNATAVTFVADPGHRQYEHDASVPTIAPVIAAASGGFGSNADYAHQLDAALADCGLSDGYVAQLVAALKAAPSSA